MTTITYADALFRLNFKTNKKLLQAIKDGSKGKIKRLVLQGLWPNYECITEAKKWVTILILLIG